MKSKPGQGDRNQPQKGVLLSGRQVFLAMACAPRGLGWCSPCRSGVTRAARTGVQAPQAVRHPGRHPGAAEHGEAPLQAGQHDRHGGRQPTGLPGARQQEEEGRCNYQPKLS